MEQVPDAFFLNMTEISAALIGLFLVGIFFYVETGFRRSKHARDVVEPYFRVSTRIVLVLFSIPIGLPLALVVMEPIWTRVIYALLSVSLVAANVDTLRSIRPAAKVTGSISLLANEVVGSAGVVAIVTVPWLLGGLHPTREDLTWAILLSFGIGFLSICTLVLSAFDIARVEDEDSQT